MNVTGLFWKQTILILITVLCNLELAQAALCSRNFTFTDGSILTASQLNTEFNTAIDCVNGIDNANLTINANIDPVKINATIAGDGIGRNGSTGVLSVNTDNSGIEINADTLRIKDLGVTTAKINDSAVTTVKINDLAVTAAKRTNLTITSSSSTTNASFATSSTTFVDVTNLTVTITANSKPILLFLSDDGTLNGDGTLVSGNPDLGARISLAQTASAVDLSAVLKLIKGTSTLVGSQLLSNNLLPGSFNKAFTLPPSAVFFIDPSPGSGSVTYKLQTRLVNASSSISFFGVKLNAIEL